MNAGCIFTNGKHILAGYQGRISGIGGKAEEGEQPQATALREMLEEIFGIHFDIEKIRLTPRQIIVKKTYTIFVYSFEDLEAICDVLRLCEVESPLYEKIPTTIWELVSKRLFSNSEITALCILPVVNHDRDVPFVEPYFVSDIRTLFSLTANQ